jgi:predicted N-acetyltransferase YhbS
MRIFHPKRPLEFAARNKLLQAALRPDPAPFAIEREYPIVLAERESAFSYCVGDGDQVVAHANLWPRVLKDKVQGKDIRVGLVGNIATDEKFRGQGLMSQLLGELKKEADKQGLKALVLWSDLLEFYQKQGFQSFGEEHRYRLTASHLATLPRSGLGFSRTKARDLDEETVKALLSRRHPVTTTLGRSPEEFRALLAIPALDVYLSRAAGGEVKGYALLGKGCDMVGVIHEWGVESPEDLVGAAARAAADTGYDDILILTPAGLPEAWHGPLARHAADVTKHGMALMWVKDEDPNLRAALSQSFIWGLDSI